MLSIYLYTYIKKSCATLYQPTIEARLTGLYSESLCVQYIGIYYIYIYEYIVYIILCANSFSIHMDNIGWTLTSTITARIYTANCMIHWQHCQLQSAISITDVTTERYQTLCLSYVFGIDKYKCMMQWMQATLALDGMPAWWTNLTIWNAFQVKPSCLNIKILI